jgi:hypothetical protein
MNDLSYQPDSLRKTYELVYLSGMMGSNVHRYNSATKKWDMYFGF